jgi:prevent-host-death family protein
MAHEPSERVGVRELRQNLSVYLRRVKEGASLDVTEHGRTVARLVPSAEGGSVLERLVAEGKVTLATGSLDDLPPLVGPITDAGTRALRAQKKDRI